MVDIIKLAESCPNLNITLKVGEAVELYGVGTSYHANGSTVFWYQDITYSRRISGKDRIIYDIYDDVLVVLIISVKGHYDDK